MIAWCISLIVAFGGVGDSTTAEKVKAVGQVRIVLQDDAPIIPEFENLRAGILAALDSSDPKRLAEYVAERVEIDGEPQAREEAVKYLLDLDARDGTSDSVGGVRQALARGALRRGSELLVPPVAIEADDIQRLMGEGTLAFISGRSVRLRSEPRDDATVVATASNVAATADALGAPRRSSSEAAKCPEWVSIRLTDNRAGWVCARYIIDLSGPYYVFRKDARRWKLVEIYTWD